MSMIDLKEIRQLAQEKGIDTRNKSMGDLIREIQDREGYESCFGSMRWDCPFYDCKWRLGCVGIAGGSVKARHIMRIK